MAAIVQKQSSSNLGSIASQQQAHTSTIIGGMERLQRQSSAITSQMSSNLANLSDFLTRKGFEQKKIEGAKAGTGAAKERMMFEQGKLKKNEFDEYSTQYGEVSEDDEGNKTYTAFEVDETSVFGQAYNSAAMATYNQEVALDAKIKAIEFRRAANGDVETFDTSYTAYKKKILSAAPTEEARYVAERRFDAYGGITHNEMLAENDTKDKNYKIGVHQKAALSTTTDAINLIKNGKSAESIINEFETAGHTLQQDGVISESTRIAIHEKVIANVQRSAAEHKFKNILQTEGLQAAQQFMDAFESEIPDKRMTITTHRAILSDMRHEFMRSQKVNNATIKATINQNDEIAKKAIKVLETGKAPADYDKILQMEYSPKVAQQLNEAITLMNDIQRFNAKTIPEQSSQIDQLKTIENPTYEDTIRLKKLSKLYDRNSKMANNDPITLSMEQGLEKTITPISANDMSGLKSRVSLFDRTEDYYGTPGKIFTQDEASSITRSYNQGSPEQKQEILNSLVNNLEGKYLKTAINQLKSKKNEHIKYNAMMMIGGNKEVSEIAMQGENADIPLPEGFKTDYNDYVSGVFDVDTGADGYNMYLKGAGNYYKGKSLGGDTQDAKDSFRESIGETKTFNGKKILLPIGVDGDQFDDWIDEIEIEDEPVLSKQLNEMNDMFGSGDIQLQSIGAGKYLIKLNSSTSPIVATDKEGNDIILEYNAK